MANSNNPSQKRKRRLRRFLAVLFLMFPTAATVAFVAGARAGAHTAAQRAQEARFDGIGEDFASESGATSFVAAEMPIKKAVLGARLTDQAPCASTGAILTRVVRDVEDTLLTKQQHKASIEAPSSRPRECAVDALFVASASAEAARSAVENGVATEAELYAWWDAPHAGWLVAADGAPRSNNASASRLPRARGIGAAGGGVAGLGGGGRGFGGGALAPGDDEVDQGEPDHGGASDREARSPGAPIEEDAPPDESLLDPVADELSDRVSQAILGDPSNVADDNSTGGDSDMAQAGGARSRTPPLAAAPVVETPLPGAMWLMIVGLAGLSFSRRVER
ncbi:MAG: hypothetical protein AAFX08_08495 [Pseudomonadota bacterium]